MKWISVKDKWPPSNTYVIVCLKDKNNDWKTIITYEKFIGNIDTEHIYWISLPKTPDELKERNRERNREYYKKNTERERLRRQKNYYRNIEKSKALNRKYYLNRKKKQSS